MVLYSIILTASLFIVKKSARQILVILAFFLILVTWNVNSERTLKSHREFIVFNIPGNAVYNYISPSGNLVITPNNNDNENIQNTLTFITEEFWLEHEATNPEFFSMKEQAMQKKNCYVRDNYMNFSGIRILRINNDAYKNVSSSKKMKLDYIILSERSEIPVKKLSNLFSFRKIILDSSISYYERQEWKEKLTKAKIPYHDVTQMGAFQLEIGKKTRKKFDYYPTRFFFVSLY